MKSYLQQKEALSNTVNSKLIEHKKRENYILPFIFYKMFKQLLALPFLIAQIDVPHKLK
jgi:hypothetical protein